MNSRRRSIDARRNSAMPLPSERASSGSRFGPSTISAIAKITIELGHADAEHGREVSAARCADEGGWRGGPGF